MAERMLLLVEDNPDDEALVMRAIRKCGLDAEIHVAHDGVEAVDWMVERSRAKGSGASRTPDLILLDLKMPRMDGFEVLRRARALGPMRRVPVVVFTSSSEERDIEQSYELGANAYVRKPIDFDDLCTAIKRIGDFWFGANVPLSLRGAARLALRFTHPP